MSVSWSIERVVVVVGCQRSGTTLTGQVFGAARDAFLLDENDRLYDWFDGLDPDSPRIPVELLQQADRKYRTSRLGADADELASGVSTLVLKAPNLTHRAHDLSRLGPRLATLYPVRDPRATVASMMARTHNDIVGNQKRFLGGSEHIADRFGTEVAILRSDAPLHRRLAAVWVIKSSLQDEFASLGFPSASFRYEDLVARADTTDQLAVALDLPADRDRRNHSSIYRGSGPGGIDRTRAIDGASIDAWRKALTNSEIDDIVEITARRAARLGYDLTTPPVGAVT